MIVTMLHGIHKYEYSRTYIQLAQPLAALFLTAFVFLGHYMLGRERQGVGKR